MEGEIDDDELNDTHKNRNIRPETMADDISLKNTEMLRDSKRSTLEAELRSLSTTPRMSHEEYGRVVSPPHSSYDLQEMNGAYIGDSGLDSYRDVMYDGETVRRDLANQQAQRKKLEKRFEDVEDEKREMNMKIAALRVKLGVANANSNVCRNECEKMRKELQDAQIKKARLEERIKSCNREIDRLSDPSNPDSNVNLKKLVINERKEIRRLRTELETIKSERTNVQEEIHNRDAKIRRLNAEINEGRDQLDTCQTDFDVAKISALSERKKREEMEEQHTELINEKTKFDNKVNDLQSQLDATLAETAEILQRTEKSKEKEETILEKIAVVERKLKDVLTEIEQQKNKNMPVRTASSIKYHQYRMSKSSVVSDTTPRAVLTSNQRGSITASGYPSKVVVTARKTSMSLPAKFDTPRSHNKGSGASLGGKK